MPRGGYRPGSGRKPKNHATDTQVDGFAETPAAATSKPRRHGARSPLKLLLDVVEDESLSLDTRMKAARDALPYTNKKPATLGKKEEAAERARAASAHFGRGRAPSNVTYFRGRPSNEK